MSEQTKWPRCPRCNGMLLPDKKQGSRVLSVKCFSCSETFHRDVKRRNPEPQDLNFRSLPHHTMKLRKRKKRRAA